MLAALISFNQGSKVRGSIGGAMLCPRSAVGELPAQFITDNSAEILPLSLVQENIKRVLFQTWEGRGSGSGSGGGVSHFHPCLADVGFFFFC